MAAPHPCVCIALTAGSAQATPSEEGCCWRVVRREVLTPDQKTPSLCCHATMSPSCSSSSTVVSCLASGRGEQGSLRIRLTTRCNNATRIVVVTGNNSNVLRHHQHYYTLGYTNTALPRQCPCTLTHMAARVQWDNRNHSKVSMVLSSNNVNLIPYSHSVSDPNGTDGSRSCGGTLEDNTETLLKLLTSAGAYCCKATCSIPTSDKVQHTLLRRPHDRPSFTRLFFILSHSGFSWHRIFPHMLHRPPCRLIHNRRTPSFATQQRQACQLKQSSKVLQGLSILPWNVMKLPGLPPAQIVATSFPALHRLRVRES